MIRYHLICEHEHAFVAWFASSAAYDEQAAGGLVECPVCGSTRVRKRLMSPAVNTGSRKAPPSTGALADDTGGGNLLDEQTRRRRELVHELHRYVRETADYVGRAFAEEARSRAGREDARPVWGEASTEEVRELLDDGIEVLPLPPLPEKKN